MRFLPEDQFYNNIIPLNIMYEQGVSYNDDLLSILYKDVETDQKSVFQIQNPKIEVYILKPEYRTYSHIRNFMEMDHCDKLTVHYKTRFSEIAKAMRLPDGEAAKISPYVFGADVEIETYYLTEFIKEYPYDGPINLHLAFLDIENDIIQCERFPVYGETPINIVTYIDAKYKVSYTLVLAKDNLPHYPTDHPKYSETEDTRAEFYEQVHDIMKHSEEFKQNLHDLFDELYGELEYNLIFFENEPDLLTALWEIIRSLDADFGEVWNLPYDLSNLLIRPEKLGMDVTELVVDQKLFGHMKPYFVEDLNAVAHKRKHICQTYTATSFVDQMVHYAGIRSSRGKLPSLKLNAIGKRELGDTKHDFSESGDLKHIFYNNLKEAIIYNIKDVLLQYGIERQTKDTDTIYARMYSNFVFPNQSFTTTKLVWNSLKAFAKDTGVTFGANKNKFGKASGMINYGDIIQNNIDDMDDDFDPFDLIDIEEEEEEGAPRKKKKQYQGAFVMNPLHMSPTGTHILGTPAKYVHDYVPDFDVTSEYPSYIVISNVSNETLVGKVFLEDPDSVHIPIYKTFAFKGDEEAEYKCDVSNFMLECYSEEDELAFGSLFLDLPTPNDVFDLIEENLDQLTT